MEEVGGEDGKMGIVEGGESGSEMRETRLQTRDGSESVTRDRGENEARLRLVNTRLEMANRRYICPISTLFSVLSASSQRLAEPSSLAQTLAQSPKTRGPVGTPSHCILPASPL